MIATVASIVLGASFVLAGASKLAAGRSWFTQARDLGAPVLVVPVVPWFELVLGGALVAGVVAPWPAVVGAVTLVVFTALLLLRLREGKRPPCACFGAWSAKPLGPGHVVRNLVLLAIAVVAIVGAVTA